MSEVDIIIPQIKLFQPALNQQSMNENVSFSSDIIEYENQQRLQYNQLKTKRDYNKNIKTLKVPSKGQKKTFYRNSFSIDQK